jgi:hypothetical protein
MKNIFVSYLNILLSKVRSMVCMILIFLVLVKIAAAKIDLCYALQLIRFQFR